MKNFRNIYKFLKIMNINSIIQFKEKNIIKYRKIQKLK